MSAKRWVLLVVVALVAGAVVFLLRSKGGDEAGPAAEPPPEPTVYQRVLAGIDPDGHRDARQSLQLFAFAFGPVPGVTLPPGREDPADLVIPGGDAIRSVLGRWDELTEPQREAVLSVLRAPEEPPGLRRADPKEAARAVLTGEVERLSTAIGAKLGKPIPVPVVHLTDKEPADERVKAWSAPLGGRDLSVRESAVGLGGAMRSCPVYFPPAVWRGSASAVPPGLEALIAHEVSHCHQAFHYGDTRTFRGAPGWIIEGGAEFMAFDVTGRSWGTPSNWVHYLDSLDPLFSRTYSALGWWFHVREQTFDPWKTMPVIWKDALEGGAAWKMAGGAHPSVYTTWAASLAREPGFGPRWEVHGVGVPAGRPPREVLHPGRTTLAAPPFTPKVAVVNVPAERPIVRITAPHPVQVHDQGSFEDIGVTSAEYCGAGSCVCPDGSEPVKQKVSAPLLLAVPGGELANSVSVDFTSLGDRCEDKKKPNPKPGAVVVPVSVAGSNGDPHLTGFDGNTFDFQAGGEFTLARSDSGDLEVQARQEPYREPGEPDDLSVSVNTAVAATVAGDRVTFAAAGRLPALKVGGRELTPTADHRLPRGGVITPVPDGYRLTWPDGTTTQVLTLGDFGLNVIIEPVAARKGTLHGLLGPFTGTQSAAMEDRAGKRYEWVSWKQLLDVVGESWRVAAPGSLFDYGPGQSTETFTRRDMPVIPAVTLPADAVARADESCRGVEDPRLRGQCVFDVGRTGKDAFAEGYRAVREATGPRGPGASDIDLGDGPLTLAPGDKRVFTVPADPATDVYLRLDGGTGALVVWGVNGPDGPEFDLVGAGVHHQRLTARTPGEWRIEVTVPPDSAPAGPVSWRAVTAGEVRVADTAVPGGITGLLDGPGARDEIRFTGRGGQSVVLAADGQCPPPELVEIELITPSDRTESFGELCSSESGENLDEDGQYTIRITHTTVERRSTPYRLTLSTG